MKEHELKRFGHVSLARMFLADVIAKVSAAKGTVKDLAQVNYSQDGVVFLSANQEVGEAVAVGSFQQ